MIRSMAEANTPGLMEKPTMVIGKMGNNMETEFISIRKRQKLSVGDGKMVNAWNGTPERCVKLEDCSSLYLFIFK